MIVRQGAKDLDSDKILGNLSGVATLLLAESNQIDTPHHVFTPLAPVSMGSQAHSPDLYEVLAVLKRKVVDLFDRPKKRTARLGRLGKSYWHDPSG